MVVTFLLTIKYSGRCPTDKVNHLTMYLLRENEVWAKGLVTHTICVGNKEPYFHLCRSWKPTLMQNIVHTSCKIELIILQIKKFSHWKYSAVWYKDSTLYISIVTTIAREKVCFFKSIKSLISITYCSNENILIMKVSQSTMSSRNASLYSSIWNRLHNNMCYNCMWQKALRTTVC